MAITDAIKAKLNAMCMVANSALLGTVIQALPEGGTYTVTADDDTANTVAIDTGRTINGFVVSILRSGKIIDNAAAVSAATTILTVADNSSSYVLTAGDVINYVIW